jgi:hypothetical protein
MSRHSQNWEEGNKQQEIATFGWGDENELFSSPRKEGYFFAAPENRSARRCSVWRRAMTK